MKFHKALATWLVGLQLVGFTGVAVAVDPAIKDCHESYLECVSRIDEGGGKKGRYPVEQEQACTISYEQCLVRKGYAPESGRLGKPLRYYTPSD